MTKFASGKNALAISDRSGFRYRYKDMRKEWNGLLVGKDEFEPKQPQLGPFKKVADAQALKDARPPGNLDSERAIQYGFNPVGFRDIPGITPPNRLVAEGSVGQVTIDLSDSGNVSVNLSGVNSNSGIGSPSAVGNVTVYTVTVVSTGSGNKYYVNGSQQPTLSLTEGSIYRFDQSDSSNSGHPLRFSTTSDGTHGGGSEYTTGVTTTGTYAQITVAVGAPTLYYYCTNHSGMGGQINT